MTIRLTNVQLQSVAATICYHGRPNDGDGAILHLCDYFSNIYDVLRHDPGVGVSCISYPAKMHQRYPQEVQSGTYSSDVRPPPLEVSRRKVSRPVDC